MKIPTVPMPNPTDMMFEVQDDSAFDPLLSSRLMNYVYILISSLINFSNTAQVQTSSTHEGAIKLTCVLFGIISFFSVALAVCAHFLNVGKMLVIERGSLTEGLLLMFLSFLWLCNVAFSTRVRGIAFSSLNIYFSAWISLLLSVRTCYCWSMTSGFLNLTSDATRTIPGWIALLIASTVQLESGIDAQKELEWNNMDEAILSIVFGSVSIICCSAMLISKYLSKDTVTPTFGSLGEIAFALFLVVWWTVGVWTLTRSGKVGSTISGSNEFCQDENGTPGSNLYFSLWASLFASCWIVIHCRKNDMDKNICKTRTMKNSQIGNLEGPILESTT